MSKKLNTSVGIERLRTLYAIMAGIPDARISLGSWRGNDECTTTRDSELKSECGTTGCAVGWACAYPEFKKSGLNYFLMSPRYKTFSGWGAVSKFFDLDNSDALALFSTYQIGPNGSVLERYVDVGAVRPARAGRDDFDQRLLVSEKRLVLMRIRNYLWVKGAITGERVEELRLQEVQGIIR